MALDSRGHWPQGDTSLSHQRCHSDLRHSTCISIMHLPGAILAALLCTAALCTLGSSAPYGTDTPTACCFSYISRQFPRKFVADYFETSSQCSKPGVIFQTKRNRQVCANPSEAWVAEYINDLELNA
ncbi:C-C motif chemokine 3-like [Tamandua tetradactyla]|uniref:C-C motif chemokine 3-like n=1 Tax=Tamandua tetradactyla TaxID=48850 RepID=UPI00405382F9